MSKIRTIFETAQVYRENIISDHSCILSAASLNSLCIRQFSKTYICTLALQLDMFSKRLLFAERHEPVFELSPVRVICELTHHHVTLNETTNDSVPPSQRNSSCIIKIDNRQLHSGKLYVF